MLPRFNQFCHLQSNRITQNMEPNHCNTWCRKPYQSCPSIPDRQQTPERTTSQATLIANAMNRYIPYNRTYQSDRQNIVENHLLSGPIIGIKTIPDPCLPGDQVQLQK